MRTKTEPVLFLSGKLALEGILTVPEGAARFPSVLICHPHPLYGGSMYNNVVDGVYEALVKSQMVAFKFNFRGVGASQGEYDDGIGEQEDVSAAISFLVNYPGVDSQKVGLAGYSAGAGFAFPVAAQDARIKALAAISPPLSMYDFTGLKTCQTPKLLVAGDQDEFVPETEFTKFCQALPEPKEFNVIKGADHFWLGYEYQLGDMVSNFFNKVFKEI